MRWILAHPRLDLTLATSAADAGSRVDSLYPALAPAVGDLRFVAPDVDQIIQSADVAVLAVPHTAALGIAPALLDGGLTVIDLSADFRLSDAAVYEHWYDTAHTEPELLAEAVYGLPELDRTRLPGARLVACPGCYPTAAALAVAPALRAGAWGGGRIVVDAKSGVTGAGRSPAPGTHYVAVNESLAPYKVGSHRHTPEMEQVFSSVAGSGVDVLFTPHLVPMSRGLLATVYIDTAPGVSPDVVLAAYQDAYSAEPLVDLCPAGVWPTTAQVRGSAKASVGLHIDERTNTLVAVCAIDNLGKGASSQGIQCLNAVLGYPETEGLESLGPVL